MTEAFLVHAVAVGKEGAGHGIGWGDVNGEAMIGVIERALGGFPEVAARTIKGMAWVMTHDEPTVAAATAGLAFTVKVSAVESEKRFTSIS